MDQSLTLTLEESTFIFDCRRVIYWPERKVLLATDLHWGKTAYLQKHGMAVPDKVFDDDLKRLTHILHDYEVKSLIVLGDLVHHEKALSHGIIEKVAYFRHAHPCELLLIKGNHDRYSHFPESWGVVEEKDFVLDKFYFTHEFKSKEMRFQFSGHLHPMMRFRDGVDQLRLPTFILSKKSCLLPAFSHLTGGQDVKLKESEKAIAVLPDGLVLFE